MYSVLVWVPSSHHLGFLSSYARLPGVELVVLLGKIHTLIFVYVILLDPLDGKGFAWVSSSHHLGLLSRCA